MKKVLSSLLIVGAGTLVSFADTETYVYEREVFFLSFTSTYDTGYPSAYYTRNTFNLHELTLSNLDLTGSNIGFPSGTYTISSLGYLMDSSTDTFASAIAIVSTDWTVLALSSSYSAASGQTFGTESDNAIATYTISATLDASTTYYVVALSSTDGITVGSTYTGTNMTTIGTGDGGNPMATTGTSSAAAYTVSWDNDTPSLTALTVSSTDSSQLNATFQVTLVTVPEPSAFGLLAGLGALAFVASRRRRRSRNAA